MIIRVKNVLENRLASCHYYNSYLYVTLVTNIT